MKQAIILLAVIFSLASCGELKIRNGGIYNLKEGGIVNLPDMHLHPGDSVRLSNGKIYHIVSMWSASPLKHDNCRKLYGYIGRN